MLVVGIIFLVGFGGFVVMFNIFSINATGNIFEVSGIGSAGIIALGAFIVGVFVLASIFWATDVVDATVVVWADDILWATDVSSGIDGFWITDVFSTGGLFLATNGFWATVSLLVADCTWATDVFWAGSLCRRIISFLVGIIAFSFGDETYVDDELFQYLLQYARAYKEIHCSFIFLNFYLGFMESSYIAFLCCFWISAPIFWTMFTMIFF